MKIEKFEVYSDETNAVIIRHPARKFPGLLMQGDTLHSMKGHAERVFAQLDEKENEESYYEMKDLRDLLLGLVNHYKSTLKKNEIALPFHEL